MMNNYEPCEMCDEFVDGGVCDFVSKCPVAKLKSENERLQLELASLRKTHYATVKELYAYMNPVEQMKSEAVREFAERMLEEINALNYQDYNNYLDTVGAVDRLLEEMGCNDG